MSALKSKKRAFTLICAMILGIVGGTLSNNSALYASGTCENLVCKYDGLSGFRCFSEPQEQGYNCNDSNYPSCSETSCTAPGEN
jgi:hypothetical protein